VKDIAMKKVVVWLQPLIAKLPPDFQPMIKGALPLLLSGNVNGAVASLKAGIIKYGVKKIGGILDKFVFSKLPSFAAAPAKNMVMGVINKAVAAHTERELGTAAAIKMANEIGAQDDLPLNMATVLIEKGFGLLGGVLPGMIDKMTEKACIGPLAPAKEPLNTELKSCVEKVIGVAKQGPTMWGEQGKTKIVKILMASAQTIATKLKNLAASALGESAQGTYIEYIHQQ